MYNVMDFVRSALLHAKRDSIPKEALLPVKYEECGTEPWEYLYGSIRVQTNKDTIDRYFRDHYANSMTREKYDSYTSKWDRSGYATDCQGLLDAYMTYELDEKTDINSDMNYKYWCEDKGEINSIKRDFVLGEAVFMARDNGTMHHIGWVCGFLPDGEPLVIEARGIAYGVMVTRLNSRPWTHRGLMKVKFSYDKSVGFNDLTQSGEGGEGSAGGENPAPKAEYAEVCAVIADFILPSGRYSLAVVKSDKKER